MVLVSSLQLRTTDYGLRTNPMLLFYWVLTGST